MKKENHNISNQEVYTSRMELGVFDKLFWTEHVFEPLDKIVDFGGGDGAMLDAYRHQRKDCPALVVVDNNPQMITAAKERLGENGVQYFSGLREMLDGGQYKNSILVLSSVIHEIYARHSYLYAKKIMQQLFNAGFKYIVIRDMATEETNAKVPLRSNASLVNGYAIAKKEYGDQLSSFENVWSHIRSKKDFLHFLLKYRYVENWEREVSENYLPLTVEKYLEMVPNAYDIEFIDVFTHPYTKHVVERDFGIKLTMHTHIKMILRRTY